MLRSDLDLARRWLSDGVGVGRAVLVRTVGSSTFAVGSTLLVADDGRMAGSVSAGCVEGAAVEAVLAARRGSYHEIVRYGVTDERVSEGGLACGGSIDVLVEPELPQDILLLARDDVAAALATRLPEGRTPDLPARVVLDAAGLRSGTLGDPEADRLLASMARSAIEEGFPRTVGIAGHDLYIEVLVPRRIVIVGAGEIAVFLVRLAGVVGYTSLVVDARGAFLTRERFPEANALLLGWADELADEARIDRDAHVVALAHDPKQDDPLIVTALRRGAKYVGVLGGRRTHAARLDRLREAGLTDDDLARIHAPVGLDLGGRSPADIAVGILAEIVAVDARRSSLTGQ